jgi:hypothetical protein
LGAVSESYSLNNGGLCKFPQSHRSNLDLNPYFNTALVGFIRSLPILCPTSIFNNLSLGVAPRAFTLSYKTFRCRIGGAFRFNSLNGKIKRNIRSKANQKNDRETSS